MSPPDRGMCLSVWLLKFCLVPKCAERNPQKVCWLLGLNKEHNYSIETPFCWKPISMCHYVLRVCRSGQTSFLKVWESDIVFSRGRYIVVFSLLLWLFPNAWHALWTPPVKTTCLDSLSTPLKTKEDAALVMLSICKSNLCLSWSFYKRTLLSPTIVFWFPWRKEDMHCFSHDPGQRRKHSDFASRMLTFTKRRKAACISTILWPYHSSAVWDRRALCVEIKTHLLSALVCSI